MLKILFEEELSFLRKIIAKMIMNFKKLLRTYTTSEKDNYMKKHFKIILPFLHY